MPKMGMMGHVSRPLLAVLLATVALFAVWIVALKPTSSSLGGKSSSGATPYQSAISKARQALTTENRASSAHGAAVPPTSPTTTAAGPAARTPGAAAAGSSTTSSAATAAARAAAGRHTAAGATRRSGLVQRALAERRVVAMLFYNPAAADDRAVKQELATVPEAAGRVVKLALPLAELARYPAITNQVPVNQSPTLVIVDRARQASTIVGFADQFEIAQRIKDALATG